MLKVDKKNKYLCLLKVAHTTFKSVLAKLSQLIMEFFHVMKTFKFSFDHLDVVASQGCFKYFEFFSFSVFSCWLFCILTRHCIVTLLAALTLSPRGVGTHTMCEAFDLQGKVLVQISTARPENE